MNALEFEGLERRIAGWIAWLTIATGAAQIVIPARLLPLIGVASNDSAAHLFATVGMFMVLFGGAVLHAQVRREALQVVLLWAGLQKIGAALLVGWGVSRGVFAPLALLIAGFDGASGLLFFDLRRRGG
ncbi:MAG TPA: hypothetical protein VN028_09675 [Rhodocyclaceae bacterium]|nr:hypothetical protein [Rhodocyclaceae bacterium]